MTEITSLNNGAATAALQLVIELIRASKLGVGAEGEEATRIIATHKQLTEHFKAIKSAASERR